MFIILFNFFFKKKLLRLAQKQDFKNIQKLMFWIAINADDMVHPTDSSYLAWGFNYRKSF